MSRYSQSSVLGTPQNVSLRAGARVGVGGCGGGRLLAPVAASGRWLLSPRHTLPSGLQLPSSPHPPTQEQLAEGRSTHQPHCLLSDY